MGFDFDSSPKSGKKVDECLNPPYKPLLRLIESDTNTKIGDSTNWYTKTPYPVVRASGYWQKSIIACFPFRHQQSKPSR